MVEDTKFGTDQRPLVQAVMTQETNSEDSQPLRQKRSTMVHFMFYMMCGAFCNGYSIPSTNQLKDLFDVKYGWKTQSEQDFHESLIGSIIVLGLAAGAFSAGKMIPYGRRKTMMLTSIIGIVGVSLTLVQEFYIFNIGRILYGFASGAQGTTVIRMIVEFMPEKR